MALKKEVAVTIRNISKEFILPQNKSTTLKQAVVNIVRRNNKTIQKVLNNINFDIMKGDFFGIVGRNGSGKSTLLKLIAGVYEPTAGNIYVYGGLTPFIELGVGFNPELSGRDNVYLNGSLLGFTRSQMNEMYDDIVEFAELGPFMDQKLKNYSSGMQVRLAFSIAVKAKNEILIFDEVLAVGDEAFQRKCLDIFEKYKADGQTVILVTHSMETVKKFCNRAALIQDGEIVKIGDPVNVADEYSRINQVAIDVEKSIENKNLAKNDQVSIELIKGKGKSKSNDNNFSFAVNEEIEVQVGWDIKFNVDAVIIDLYKNNGQHITNYISNREGIRSLEGRNRVNLRTSLNITPGSYFLAVGLWERNLNRKIATLNPAIEFSISENWSMVDYKFGGTTHLDHKWI